MIRAIKTPQERGFNIPVMFKIGEGRYKKAFARSLVTKNGKIIVCYDSGRRSSWDTKNTIHVPQGFNEIPDQL